VKGREGFEEGKQVQGTRIVKGREVFSNMGLVQGASLSDEKRKGTVEVLVPGVAAEQKGSETVIQGTSTAAQGARSEPGKVRITTSRVVENTAGTKSEQDRVRNLT
jgi:hypothetical protein